MEYILFDAHDHGFLDFLVGFGDVSKIIGCKVDYFFQCLNIGKYILAVEELS